MSTRMCARCWQNEYIVCARLLGGSKRTTARHRRCPEVRESRFLGSDVSTLSGLPLRPTRWQRRPFGDGSEESSNSDLTEAAETPRNEREWEGEQDVASPRLRECYGNSGNEKELAAILCVGSQPKGRGFKSPPATNLCCCFCRVWNPCLLYDLTSISVALRQQA